MNFSYPFFDVEDILDQSKFFSRTKELVDVFIHQQGLSQFYNKTYTKAKEFYADLPYHNEPHHLCVSVMGVYIAKKIGRSELIRPIIKGLLWHDAGYDIDVKNTILPEGSTKEDYAIMLMKKHDSDDSSRFHSLAEQGIDGTKLHPNSWSEIGKICRAADIRGLGGNFEIFLANTENLRLEYNLLHSSELSFDEYKDVCIPFLEDLLSQKEMIQNRYFALPDTINFYDNFEKNIEKLKNYKNE